MLAEITAALAEVRNLSNLLPICAWCKKFAMTGLLGSVGGLLRHAYRDPFLSRGLPGMRLEDPREGRLSTPESRARMSPDR